MQHPFNTRSSISASAVRRARAASSRVSPHPEIQPAQWRLFACHVSAGCALGVTAVSSHHGLAPKDRGLPPMQSPSTVRGPITTSTARCARAASLPVSPPPERQPAQWRLIACHVNAGCALEVTARRLRQGLAPNGRGLPTVPYSPVAGGPTSTSVTRRARAESLRVSPPPGQWRLLSCHANAGCALEVTAHRSHHGLAPKDRGRPSVQYSSTARGPTTTFAARRARAASLPIPPPLERQPAQWRLFACHVNAGCELEVRARRSHQGLAPNERGLPPV